MHNMHMSIMHACPREPRGNQRNPKNPKEPKESKEPEESREPTKEPKNPRESKGAQGTQGSRGEGGGRLWNTTWPKFSPDPPNDQVDLAQICTRSNQRTLKQPLNSSFNGSGICSLHSPSLLFSYLPFSSLLDSRWDWVWLFWDRETERQALAVTHPVIALE